MPAPSRTADDPPKRTPSFVCEVPLRVISCPGAHPAGSPGSGTAGLQRLPGRSTPAGPARARVQSLPAGSDALPGRPRAEAALCPCPGAACLLGLCPAGICQAVSAFLAGRASGQPHHPKAGFPRLWRRQPAARRQGQTGSLQRQAPTRQCGRQDQHQWHSLVWRPRGVDWARACPPCSIRKIRWWPTACPVRSSMCGWCAASWGCATASTPNWSVKASRIASRSTRWGRGSWVWTWDRARWPW